jgi:hypothetical protein
LTWIMDVLATVRQILAAIFILLCAGSATAVSPLIVAATDHKGELIQLALVHATPAAQGPSLLPRVTSGLFQSVSLEFPVTVEMAADSVARSVLRIEERLTSIARPPSQNVLQDSPHPLKHRLLRTRRGV